MRLGDYRKIRTSVCISDTHVYLYADFLEIAIINLAYLAILKKITIRDARNYFLTFSAVCMHIVNIYLA